MNKKILNIISIIIAFVTGFLLIFSCALSRWLTEGKYVHTSLLGLILESLIYLFFVIFVGSIGVIHRRINERLDQHLHDQKSSNEVEGNSAKGKGLFDSFIDKLVEDNEDDEFDDEEEENGLERINDSFRKAGEDDEFYDGENKSVLARMMEIFRDDYDGYDDDEDDDNDEIDMTGEWQAVNSYNRLKLLFFVIFIAAVILSIVFFRNYDNRWPYNRMDFYLVVFIPVLIIPLFSVYIMNLVKESGYMKGATAFAFAELLLLSIISLLYTHSFVASTRLATLSIMSVASVFLSIKTLWAPDFKDEKEKLPIHFMAGYTIFWAVLTSIILIIDRGRIALFFKEYNNTTITNAALPNIRMRDVILNSHFIGKSDALGSEYLDMYLYHTHNPLLILIANKGVLFGIIFVLIEIVFLLAALRIVLANKRGTMFDAVMETAWFSIFLDAVFGTLYGLGIIPLPFFTPFVAFSKLAANSVALGLIILGVIYTWNDAGIYKEN